MNWRKASKKTVNMNLELICRIYDVEKELTGRKISDYFSLSETEEMNGPYARRHLFGKYLAKMIIAGLIKTGEYNKIEILNGEKGKPELEKNDFVVSKCTESKIGNIRLSISHSKSFIGAFVVYDYYNVE
jgi:phosphopantetheinyl transferase (holo-ACP synthase)